MIIIDGHEFVILLLGYLMADALAIDDGGHAVLDFTLGGFVFSHLGYIPKSGESFVFNGLKFIVTSAGPRSVKRIRIRKLTPEKKPD